MRGTLLAILAALALATQASAQPPIVSLKWNYTTYWFSESVGGTLKAELDVWCDVQDLIIEGRNKPQPGWIEWGGVVFTPGASCFTNQYIAYFGVPFEEIRFKIILRDGSIVYHKPWPPNWLPLLLWRD